MESKSRMIQTALQNDTILRQLDSKVELNSAPAIKIQRQLIQPENIRLVDSISKADSARAQKKKAPLKIQSFQEPVQEIVTDSVIVEETVEDSITIAPEIKTVVEKPEVILPEKKIDRQYADWSIGIFVLALILFASVRIFFNKYLNQIFTSAINYPSASRMFRERSVSLLHGSFRLEVLFYVVVSYFLYQAGLEFELSLFTNSFTTYLSIFGGVILYFIGKRVIYYLIGFFTESMPSTQEYFFNINQFNRIIGILILPVSIIINFASLSNPKSLIYFGLSMLIIAYILSLLRGARILLSKHFSIFYLILYLCTLEILPLVYLFKLLLV